MYIVDQEFNKKFYELYEQGLSQKEIARITGRMRSDIQQIIMKIRKKNISKEAFIKFNKIRVIEEKKYIEFKERRHSRQLPNNQNI